MAFELHPLLERDSIPLAEHSEFLYQLINDSRFPWVIIVPQVPNIKEIHELTPIRQQALSRASVILGRLMMETLDGDKLNTGALGNIVSQLHLHHVVRYANDEAWPGPVWGSGTAIPYDEQAKTKLISQLRAPLLERLSANNPDQT